MGRLRIDTHDYVGDAKLKRLVIRQEGYETIEFSPAKGFEGMQPLGQIEESMADDSGMRISSSGEDPNFECVVAVDQRAANWGSLILRFLLIASLSLVVFYCCAPLVPNLTIVPVLLFGVWILIFTMASVSRQNAHPDEYVHIAAVSYYADHWLPPAVDDPEIRNTYSVYGYSRLYTKEIYYLFAGKVSRVLQTFDLQGPVVYRAFGAFLFGIVFFLSTSNLYARYAALPFLLSPQIWYTFSYCNSDAFALLVAFLMACQLVNPESLLHRFLKNEGTPSQLAGLLLLPLLLGTAFLLKANYYPFLAFFFLVLMFRVLFTEEYYWEKKDAFKRLTVIGILGLCIFGVRAGADYVVSGPDRVQKIEAMKVEHADYAYKSTTPLEDQHYTLNMKERGFSFKDMISKVHWGIKTFQSSFGVYGYLTIYSPQHYFRLVQWIGLGLFGFLLVSSLVRGGYLGAGVCVVACGLSIALTGVSLYHSWVDDFQAQGRYLFPIIPMMSIVLGHNMKALNKNILCMLVGTMFLCSVYSFIFYGLHRIAKLTY